MSSQRPNLSFEFFPPRNSEAVAKLARTRKLLTELSPGFFSVTFGAGGSTRELTLETALETRDDTGVDTAPHLSCIGYPLAELTATLEQYRAAGITRIVALRGDLPSGTPGAGEFRYASELVEFVRRESGNHFHIEVAGYPEMHPQARSADDDLDNLARKVDAGADGIITQYFYNADAFADFVSRCRARGISVPITAGIMPITNFSNLKRFSDACGAEIPRWIEQRLRALGDDRTGIREFGIEVTTRLVERLLGDGAQDLHFYTMNGAEATRAVCRNLSLGQADKPDQGKK